MPNADDDDKLWRYPKDEKRLKRWETGVYASVAENPAAWDTYDVQIQTVIAAYTNRLSGTPGYVPLDWKKVKAMLWVESGAANIATWPFNPMQIGKNGDPGLKDVLTSSHGKIILPKEYATVLNMSNVTQNGNLNIQAGIGYLLRRLANFHMVPDPPKTPSPLVPSSTKTPPNTLGPLATPKPSDAHKSSAKHHHPAKHHSPAKKHPVPVHLKITSWKTFSFPWVASTYNNHGDGNYADKLQYAYDIITGNIKPQLPKKPVHDNKKSVPHQHHKKP